MWFVRSPPADRIVIEGTLQHVGSGDMALEADSVHIASTGRLFGSDGALGPGVFEPTACTTFDFWRRPPETA